MDGGRDAARATGVGMVDRPAETTAVSAASTGVTGPGSAGSGVQPAGEAPERPPLAGRISYVFGGVLPARYGSWVSRDLLGPGWRRRQALRPVLMMLPFAVIFAVLPGPVGTRGMLVGFLLVAAGALGLGLSGTFRNRRLVQHGFPPVLKVNTEDIEPDQPTDDQISRPLAAAPETAEAAAASTKAAGKHPAGVGADLDDPEGINA